MLQAFDNKNINLLQAAVFDINPTVTAKLKERFPDIVVSSLEETASREIVILALHAPAIPETLGKIASVVTRQTILASLAPKITSEMFRNRLPAVSKLVRMIPNATSIINEGYNPIWFSPSFPSVEKEIVLQMMDFLGTTHEVEESKLEAYAVVSAMAPTYFWFQWEKLVELGREFGLGHNEAKEALLQSLYGAIETFFNSRMQPGEVMDLIPVKPIGEHEAEILAFYDKKLRELFKKLTS